MSFFGKIGSGLMSGFKFLYPIIETVGVMAIKAKNPSYSALIDGAVKDLKRQDFKAFGDKALGFSIASEEQKLLDKLEDQRVEREKLIAERDKSLEDELLIIPINVDDINEIQTRKLIEDADISNFNPKYFTREQLLAAVMNVRITNKDERFIAYECEGFIKGTHGHFSVAIMNDNTLRLAGHGGNAHNVGLTKTDYIPDILKVDYYILVWTMMEGRGKIVLGISQAVKRSD